MSRLSSIKDQKNRRKLRVRSTITTSSDRPRLSVFVSNKHVTAQIIDDTKQKTLVYASTIGNPATTSGKMTEKAEKIGLEIAEKALKAKISKVAFDRGTHIYHGRIKALAEAAKKEGLEF